MQTERRYPHAFTSLMAVLGWVLVVEEEARWEGPDGLWADVSASGVYRLWTADVDADPIEYTSVPALERGIREMTLSTDSEAE